MRRSKQLKWAIIVCLECDAIIIIMNKRITCEFRAVNLINNDVGTRVYTTKREGDSFIYVAFVEWFLYAKLNLVILTNGKNIKILSQVFLFKPMIMLIPRWCLETITRKFGPLSDFKLVYKSSWSRFFRQSLFIGIPFPPYWLNSSDSNDT